ncbi:cytidylyltransferase domain-containing protein [Candidatus Nitrosotenuis sp. DW1]|uniref:cytidylyltransferase domain-containing protein n=1 Tax=Candidatus Nitrosotenuis sp. DW1 TaxID=2259672 RepID=UPI0015CE8F27|nr:NTP transferase domain-containing protein [Candidatus Nitrosotenuis sp. DW1]QLH09681.1 acylneuraminate cytidylyltransferase [Candidatus Nitrosotenuis sp. DW1]
MNADIFILARLGSSRLPEKQLKEIDGIPAIKRLVDRLSAAKKVRNIVVCTTNTPSDDRLVDFLIKEKITYFRGNEKDVLARLLDAAGHFKTDVIIDVEGDKLYVDPVYVDKTIDEMAHQDVDFVIGSDNGKFDPTDHFIHGIIPAGIRVAALAKLCKLKKASDTETGYKEFFTSNLFSIKYIKPEINSKHSKNIRLTLDYQEDLELANIIFKELGNNFHLYDLVELFNKKPELTKITESIMTKWKNNYKNHTADFALNEST